jgi:hypothetical protein
MPPLDEYIARNKSSIVADSVDALFSEFGALGRLSSHFSYYRGHSGASYKICSTIERFRDKYGFKGVPRFLVRDKGNEIGRMTMRKSWYPVLGRCTWCLRNDVCQRRTGYGYGYRSNELLGQ